MSFFEKYFDFFPSGIYLDPPPPFIDIFFGTLSNLIVTDIWNMAYGRYVAIETLIYFIANGAGNCFYNTSSLMLVRNESLATVVRHLVPPRSIWEPNTTPNTPYSKRNTILPYSRIFHRSFRYVSAMKEQTSETKPHPFDSVKPTN